MSLAVVRKLLETRLNANAGGLPIAFENVPFTPQQGVAHQRAVLLPATAENPTMGDSRYRQPGVFQVSVYFPQNEGPANATARAVALQAAFARGLSLSEGSTTVRILSSPSLSAARNEAGWFSISVSIPFIADMG